MYRYVSAWDKIDMFVCFLRNPAVEEADFLVDPVGHGCLQVVRHVQMLRLEMMWVSFVYRFVI